MNNMLTTQKPQTTPAKWDIFYSTYYWKIYLDTFNTLNNPSVEFLTGYSKKEKQSEAQDIHHVLKAKILNLNSHGYFERMKRMEIYMRVGEMINKKTDPDIIILYPTHYTIPSENHEYIYKRFASFLDEFYRRKKDHKSMEGILPQLKSRTSKDFYLDVTKQHFNHISQLYTHAGKLLLYGHSEGAVNDFILKYKQLRKWI